MALSAYRMIDHNYDVVVVGAGGAGLRATFGARLRKFIHCLHYEGISYAKSYCGSPGWNQRCARKHGGG